jgi:hypothetical protein
MIITDKPRKMGLRRIRLKDKRRYEMQTPRTQYRIILKCTSHKQGHAVAKLVEVLRYMPKSRGLESRRCHWNSSLTSFRPHYGPGVDSVSNRNEYQEYFLEVTAAGA